MNIGEEERTIIAEPLEDPFHPVEVPDESPAPAEVPVEPEKVPA